MVSEAQAEPREGIEPPTGDYKSPVIPFNYRGSLSAGRAFYERSQGLSTPAGSFDASWSDGLVAAN